LIFGYFKEVELRIKNAEIIADKSIDLREFNPLAWEIVDLGPLQKLIILCL
jgi:hypothetical protein